MIKGRNLVRFTILILSLSLSVSACLSLPLSLSVCAYRSGFKIKIHKACNFDYAQVLFFFFNVLAHNIYTVYKFKKIKVIFKQNLTLNTSSFNLSKNIYEVTNCIIRKYATQCISENINFSVTIKTENMLEFKLKYLDTCIYFKLKTVKSKQSCYVVFRLPIRSIPQPPSVKKTPTSTIIVRVDDKNHLR